MAGGASGQALGTPAGSTKIVVRPRTSDALSPPTIVAVIRTCSYLRGRAEVDHALGDVAGAIAVASVESGQHDQGANGSSRPTPCRTGRGCSDRRPALLNAKLISRPTLDAAA